MTMTKTLRDEIETILKDFDRAHCYVCAAPDELANELEQALLVAVRRSRPALENDEFTFILDHYEANLIAEITGTAEKEES